MHFYKQYFNVRRLALYFRIEYSKITLNSKYYIFRYIKYLLSSMFTFTVLQTCVAVAKNHIIDGCSIYNSVTTIRIAHCKLSILRVFIYEYPTACINFNTYFEKITL